MIGAHSADQVRAAERPALDAGMGAELMCRASHGLALTITRELRARRGRVYGARVTGLIGKGNNGGDGLWALAFLARRGVAVTAVLVDASAHAEGLAALLAAGGRAVRLAPGDPAQQDGSASDHPARDDAARLPLCTLAEAQDQCVRADIVIDAILGTGSRGGLRGTAAGLVELLLREGSEGRAIPYVVACDVPSGVDPTTGEVTGPVLRAGTTVTFATAKSGLFLPPGAGCAGRVEVVPIGVEDRLPEPVVLRLAPEDVSRLLPRPAAEGHKYTRGVLGVVAGSEEYPGAALLACTGALAAGAGMVRYFGPPSVAALVNAALPEVVCHTGPELQGRVQAWVLGSGVSGEEQLDRCRQALSLGQPAVVDAGALDLVGERVEDRPELILTPHAGELARLLGRLGTERDRAEVEATAGASLREAVRLTGTTILLKGPHTLCHEPGGSLFSQADGTPWLATAGSGDVLAGVLGALLAQGGAAPSSGREEGDAGRWAATAALAAAVHGRAGRIASGEADGGRGHPITARDIAHAVRLVWDAP
ncbi:NAD(P)H-hydrate dehydratase [Arthrobacter sp. Y-9]|uniref:NAD(P)H-hydrate dehydratase n=1 Tax=Arthrobacter sp. Y-9 TaxID=3039385 RepID=UPI00241DE4BA|nr:NAD(P)H-hydrate dehydratase [Arthrobacter sp. Y-9]WFR83327.1 NAD(P)H-hydrate dehydratase [Arthrobacter sp. Y-9]